MRIRVELVALITLVLLPTAVHSLRSEAEESGSSVAGTEAQGFRWVGEDGETLPFADADAAVEFLRSAEIVERERIDHGVTRPQRLTLEKDGIRARAVFHNVDIEKPRERLANGDILYNFRDTYRNNVAAYELSRLLGVPNVPPAVVRRAGKEEGSVQLWVEASMNRLERSEQPPEALSLGVRRRMDDMKVFDNLINNIDRNAGNMLFDSLGEFWMIDHTRALSRSEDLPSVDKIKRCSRSLFTAIRDLDETLTRERLAPYMSSFELDALFKRRDQLVEFLEKKIKVNGEKNILFSYDL